MAEKMKMTIEDARELKGDLELSIKELFEAFTQKTGIVIAKVVVKVDGTVRDQEQLVLHELSPYLDVDTTAEL